MRHIQAKDHCPQTHKNCRELTEKVEGALSQPLARGLRQTNSEEPATQHSILHVHDLCKSLDLKKTKKKHIIGHITLMLFI